ncbi:thiamine pyrophosphate-dependent dehydrogenase E1 component subunit alpha, partial [Staphylococcus haemolyticus]
SDDDDTYRTKEEREALKTYDCNLKFKDYLLEKEIINQEWLDNIEQEHKEIINKATKDAEKAPYPSVEETYQFVYDPEGGMGNE